MCSERIKVEVLYWRECPSWSEALERVRRAISEIEGLVGRHGIFELSVSEVSSEDEALAVGFYGSPTIRVCGRDIDEGSLGFNRVGLTCRVYIVDERVLPLPPYEYIRDRIREIASAVRPDLMSVE